MESYFIKSSVALVMLYALYRVVLRYELNHQLNRLMGLLCIFFSLVVPFVQFSSASQASRFPGVYAVVTGAADVRENVSAALPAHSLDIVLILYALGAGICFVRCVFGLVTLLKLYRYSPRRQQWGFTVVTLDRRLSPFTFFNVLFIGKDHIQDSERNTMLTHERIHRDQYHSLDNIFLEAVAIVFWFNPVVWLFRRDIRAAHEYYADEHVLKNGISPEDYQYMLFKARTGIAIDFGNYLSNSTSLLKRFDMMMKTRTNPQNSYWRVSLYIALMSVIAFFGAFTSRTNEPQFDKIATYEQGEAAMYQTLGKRVKYPVTARTENRSGVVNVSFTVTEKGDVHNIKAETRKDGYLLREMVVVGYHDTPEEAKEVDQALMAAAVDAVQGLGKFTPAQKDGKAASCVLTLPIRFTIRGSKEE